MLWQLKISVLSNNLYKKTLSDSKTITDSLEQTKSTSRTPMSPTKDRACTSVRAHMSHVMRKPVCAIFERQRRRSACSSVQSDLYHFFCCLDSIIPLISISEISSLYLASVAAQAGLCLTWSQTPKTGFLVTMSTNKAMHRKSVFCCFKLIDAQNKLIEINQYSVVQKRKFN